MRDVLRPRVNACSSFFCIPDEPRKMRGLLIHFSLQQVGRRPLRFSCAPKPICDCVLARDHGEFHAAKLARFPRRAWIADLVPTRKPPFALSPSDSGQERTLDDRCASNDRARTSCEGGCCRTRHKVAHNVCKRDTAHAELAVLCGAIQQGVTQTHATALDCSNQ